MNSMIKGIFLGGAVGAAVGAIQVWQQQGGGVSAPAPGSGDSDDTTSFADTYQPSAGQTIAKAAGIGAAVGGVLGLFAGWRRKRKARKAQEALEEATVLAVAAAQGRRFWRRTQPKVEALVETAIDRAVEAIEVAKPKVEHAVEVARPKVEHAVEVATEKAKVTYEAARPKVEHAVEVAAEKARETYEAARSKPEEPEEPAATATHNADEYRAAS